MAKESKKMKEISADERMREMYFAREKYRLDMVSKLKYAERKGREEGIEEVVKNSIAKGLPTEIIMDITGLDKAIRKKL